MRHKTLAIISLDSEGITEDVGLRDGDQNLHPKNNRLASFSDNSFDQSDFREPGERTLYIIRYIFETVRFKYLKVLKHIFLRSYS